jgi:hypothetical protein
MITACPRAIDFSCVTCQEFTHDPFGWSARAHHESVDLFHIGYVFPGHTPYV